MKDAEFEMLLQVMSLCDKHRTPETAWKLAIQGSCKACDQDRNQELLTAVGELLAEAVVRQDINAFAYVDFRRGSFQKLIDVYKRQKA